MPVVSGKEMLKILVKQGFEIVGRKGSHIRIKKKTNPPIILVVPDHKELAIGTLNEIIKEAQLTKEKFIELLKS